MGKQSFLSGALPPTWSSLVLCFPVGRKERKRVDITFREEEEEEAITHLLDK